MPANEHLTMQIADQVYDLETAANACIELADGEPAYDLMSTKLHLPNETRFALDVFAEKIPASRRTHGCVTGADFIELADRYGIPRQRAIKIVDRFCESSDDIDRLITRSFLSEQAKEDYRSIVEDRRRALRIRSNE